VLGPDGQPLSIPRDEHKLPLKPGDPARTAPVVATETALVGAFGDSGYPFAKVADRRVEIDKDAHTMDVTYTLDPGAVMRFGPLAIGGLERLVPPMSRGGSAGSAARGTTRARSRRLCVH
jgi:translocation and assembly module TamA